MNNATRTPLDVARWHWQHGPIDLILGADGEPSAVQAAYEVCWARFVDVLPELVGELALLRQPVPSNAAQGDCALKGPVGRRMWSACHPHRARYITPMAAVAGSVADELITAFAREGISRAFINNGGDIALYLTERQQYRVGVFADLAALSGARLSGDQTLDANLTLDAVMPTRGVATSGWRGRSFSLGIADSVTVLARNAATADAAATMIANAVDLDHAGIVRRPASSLKDDSDLGDMLVTVDVPSLPQPLIDFALARGVDAAQRLQEQGLIEGAALFLQGRVRVAGGTCRNGALFAQRAQITTEAPCSRYAAC
ncbi:thiamine biosynthesis protein ApbE [Paraburkholderia phytofirmans OLGA172]|uniref:Thiamine biosynthesis protein ApbE n=2 Tax=Paraburkholderia phytofirmans TaxID=261302 RepID=A0A167WHI3_9BURK|nr:thiamine biosynthesis protein ApbE [Paraburkholderia phytofirmans OLGA172]